MVGFGCWALGSNGERTSTTPRLRRPSTRRSMRASIGSTPHRCTAKATRTRSWSTPGTTQARGLHRNQGGVRLGGDGGAEQRPASRARRVDTEASLSASAWTPSISRVHWPVSMERASRTHWPRLRARASGHMRHFGLCSYEADSVVEASAADGMVGLQTLLFCVESLSASCAVLSARPRHSESWPTSLCHELLTGKFKRATFPESDMRSWDERFQGLLPPRAGPGSRPPARGRAPRRLVCRGRGRLGIAQPSITAAIQTRTRADSAERRGSTRRHKPENGEGHRPDRCVHGGW